MVIELFTKISKPHNTILVFTRLNLRKRPTKQILKGTVRCNYTRNRHRSDR